MTDTLPGLPGRGAAAIAPTVAVVIASAGRAALLADVVEDVRAQSGVDVRAVVSVPDQGSLPAADRLAGWQLVVGTRGLAAQRNAALDVLGEADLVFFFDDDAVVRADYVARAVAFFAAHPEVVGLTGRVLLDGATSGEIPTEVAAAAIEGSTDEPVTGAWQSTRELYGCNFAYRRSAAPDLRFDARLPLYSWLEDHDFARRLMRVGTLARVEDCVIVHRAASSGGRQAHARLGYSQMMNPVYLWRKGSFPLWLAAHEIVWRTGKNLVYSVTGTQSSWRRERLRGNALAVRDVVRGRLTPERILEL